MTESLLPNDWSQSKKNLTEGISLNNYKMRIKKAEDKQPSKNQLIKSKLEARLSYWNVSHTQIKQANENYHKSQTQSIDNEDLKEEAKQSNNQLQVFNLDESAGPLAANILRQKSEEPEERITIKFKWASNFRNRKGSEDIALNRLGSSQAYKDSTSFQDSRVQIGKFNRENSGLSNQNELHHVASFENRLENFQSNKGFLMGAEPISKKSIRFLNGDRGSDLRIQKQKELNKWAMIKSEMEKYESMTIRGQQQGTLLHKSNARFFWFLRLKL